MRTAEVRVGDGRVDSDGRGEAETLGIEEGESGGVGFVGEGSSPEDVEETGVVGVASGVGGRVGGVSGLAVGDGDAVRGGGGDGRGGEGELLASGEEGGESGGGRVEHLAHVAAVVLEGVPHPVADTAAASHRSRTSGNERRAPRVVDAATERRLESTVDAEDLEAVTDVLAFGEVAVVHYSVKVEHCELVGPGRVGLVMLTAGKRDLDVGSGASDGRDLQSVRAQVVDASGQRAGVTLIPQPALNLRLDGPLASQLLLRPPRKTRVLHLDRESRRPTRSSTLRKTERDAGRGATGGVVSRRDLPPPDPFDVGGRDDEGGRILEGEVSFPCASYCGTEEAEGAEGGEEEEDEGTENGEDGAEEGVAEAVVVSG